MPNEIAYLALFLWPLVCAFVYQSTDTLSATSFTFLGGFLLLPAGTSFDAPLIPPLNKESLSALVALVMLNIRGTVTPVPLPASGKLRFLVLLSVFSPVITVLTNPEPVITTERFINGLSAHDAFSAVVNGYLGMVPFIVATKLIKTTEDVHRVLIHLLIAAVCVTVPALYEVRMSPQLHTIFYGFFPHEFVQQFRSGGFRPVVFTGHGLIFAMFLATSIAAACVCVRTRTRLWGAPPTFTLLYLCVVLVLCKSVGPTVLACLMFLSVAWLPIAFAARVIAVLAFLTLMYPLMNIMGWFPADAILDFVAGFSQDRAGSLGVRFRNEAELLSRALEKPWFGWGSWGRNRLDNSVTDGFWIIKLGTSGFIGFIAVYGLVLLSPIQALGRVKSIENVSARATIIGAISIAAALGINSIPNTGMHNVAWYLIGVAAAISMFSGQGAEHQPPSTQAFRNGQKN